jgi:hypothetical protein
LEEVDTLVDMPGLRREWVQGSGQRKLGLNRRGHTGLHRTACFRVSDLPGFEFIWTTIRKDLHVTRYLLKYSFVALSLGLFASATAFGMAFRPGHVPEVDPSLAIGGLTLLAGTIAVLRIQRKK